MATPKHIRELFDLASTNVRLKALVLVLKDTGLRVSDVEQLTVEDFRNSRLIPDSYGRYFKRWAEPISSQKTGVNAYVHLGYESIQWVESYIGNRKEGPIFLTKSGKKPMKSHSMTTAIKNLCKPLYNRGFKISAHSLRIFFLTTFDSFNADKTGKRIAGKRLPPTDDPYYATGENLTLKYIEIYNAERGLAVFDKGQIAQTQEDVEQLKEELEREVQDLKDKLDSQGKTLSKLRSAIHYALVERDEGMIKAIEEIFKIKDPDSTTIP